MVSDINEREIKDIAAIRLLLFQLTDVAAVILIAVLCRFEVWTWKGCQLLCIFIGGTVQ